MRISILTPHLPGRERQLGELHASIISQRRQPDHWVVSHDFGNYGPTSNANIALQASLISGCDYILPFSDDNVMYPQHLEVLESLAQGGADICYTPPVVIGRNGWQPNDDPDPERIKRESYIDASALVRRELFIELQGWNPEAFPWPDWDFYKRAVDIGAVFARDSEQTWEYRFHGGNVSLGGLETRWTKESGLSLAESPSPKNSAT